MLEEQQYSQPQEDYKWAAEYQEQGSHGHSAELISKFVAPGGQVIDLGAGSGVLGRPLIERGYKYCGLEVDPAGLALMQEHNVPALSCDLGNLDELKTRLDSFEHIEAFCLLDVIEHLVEPQTLLSFLSSYCTQRGFKPFMAISVPNVTHHDLGIKLLLGQWKVTPNGLLDFTHVRFFSNETLQELLGRCGWGLLERRDTTTENTEQCDEMIVNDLPIVAHHMLRGLSEATNPYNQVYQFIWLLQPVKSHFSNPPNSFLEAVEAASNPLAQGNKQDLEFAILQSQLSGQDRTITELIRINEAYERTNQHAQNLEQLLIQRDKSLQESAAHIKNIEQLAANYKQAAEKSTKDASDLEKKLSQTTEQIHSLEQHYSNQLKNLEQHLQHLQQQHDSISRHRQEILTQYKALLQTRTVRASRSLGLVAQQFKQNLRVSSNILGGPLIHKLHGPFEGRLDLPQPDQALAGTVEVGGWASSNAAPVQQVEVFLANHLLGLAEYGSYRPDVIQSRPWLTEAECGYRATLHFIPVAEQLGSQTLQVVITDTRGNRQVYERTVVVEPAPRPPEAPVNSVVVVDTSEAYSLWISRNEPGPAELGQQRTLSSGWSYRPLISIITPVYNTPLDILQATIASVINQTYSNWEWCLADGASSDPKIVALLSELAQGDARVKLTCLERNLGIVGNSNAALTLSEGEFMVLLDHDDTLAPNAFYDMVSLLHLHPEAAMVYSDEDKIDEQGQRFEPFFKPDWSPDLFHSMMYTCHLGFYRSSLVKEIGGFQAGFDGAQDYDLVLRLIERTDQLYHLPKVLYHWRTMPGSTARGLKSKNYAWVAQFRAMSAHLRRCGLNASVEPGLAENTLRVRYQLTEHPRISIIIPTRDQGKVLKRCIDSIQSLSTYPNYEIVVVNNGSHEPSTLEYFEQLRDQSPAQPGVQILDYPAEFNFSAINNFAVAHTTGELILLLNDDTEVITPQWLEAMVEHAVRPEVGAVGARLLYPNNTLQHAGVILGLGHIADYPHGVAGHSHKYLSAEQSGYFSRAVAIQNFSAVTAACLMTRREVFSQVGGLDSENLTVAFNDIDFCLKIREAGYLIVWTPYAELTHYESLSRGTEDSTPEKQARFQRELGYMLRRWSHRLANDPYYSPNLTLDHENFSIAPVSRYRSNPTP